MFGATVFKVATSPLSSAWRAIPWSTAVGLTLWIAAVGLAFRAQYLFTPLQQLPQGRILYGIAALLGLVGVLLIEQRAPLPEPAPAAVSLEPWRWRSARRIVATVLALFGVAGSLSTVYWLSVRSAYGPAVWIWLGSMLVLLIGAALGARNSIRSPFSLGEGLGVRAAPLSRSVGPVSGPALGVRGLTRWRVVEVLVLVGIIALTVWLRFPNLDAIPPEVHGDEAAVGLEARRVLRGQAPNIFWVGWYHIPYVSFAIPSVTMRLFGDDLFGFRLASAILGTVSVVLLYLIVRRLFGVRPAVVAAFLLGVSHWHIHFSRDGINYIQALFATLLVFYFLLRAFDTRRAVDFILAGFAMGLCVDVYYAARLAPALAGLYTLHRIVGERGFLRRQWPGLLAVALGLIVFLAPMGVVFSRSPETLLTRTSGVFLFTRSNLDHSFYGYRVNRVEEVLLIQARRTLEAFNISGETSLQHNHKGPLIDFWSSALLVLGAAVVTFRSHQSRYFLVASWLWLTLLTGAILTVDAPFSPRIIGVIPTLVILPALVVDAGWRAAATLFGRVGRYGFALPVAVFLALSLQANYRAYFDEHISKYQPAGFYSVLSAFVRQINDRYRVYLIGKADTSLKYDTPHFLLPEVDGVDVRNQSLVLPLQRIPSNKGIAFLVDYGAPDYAQRMAQIRQVYPGGREQLHKTVRDFPLFGSYVVEHEAVVAANPRAAQEVAPSPPWAGESGGRGSAGKGEEGVRPLPPAPDAGRGERAEERGGTLLALLSSLFPASAPPVAAKPTVIPARSAAPSQAGSSAPAPAAKAREVSLPPAVGAQATLRIGGFQEPWSVAVDREGRIYVADRAASVVRRFDADGKPDGTIGRPGEGPGTLKDPRAVAVDSAGQVLVLDSSRNAVSRFQSEGTFVSSFPVPGGYFPSGLAVGSDGSIYVADTGGSRALRFRPSGEAPAVIGRADPAQGGAAEARLDQPTDVAVAADGEVYVADTGHSRIAVYGPDGGFRRAWPVPRAGTINGPHVAISGDRIYVTDPEGRNVISFDRKGREQQRLGGGEFIRPVAIAVDGSGVTYVIDVEARLVFRYGPW
ncbi:MAG: glycosyltransferase family 39 protein [Chloroflexi bacterium]|nr:glycosyltransferase family 39 protein [Chloroflexota bacterium]